MMKNALTKLKNIIKKTPLFFLAYLFYALSFYACGESANDAPATVRESYKSGRIHITADESYQPVIAQAVEVYENSYPDAHLIVHYKTYAACLRDMYDDSTRLVLLPHMPTMSEESDMRARLGFKPSYGNLVFDAIAVVAHKKYKKNVLEMHEILDLLTRSTYAGSVVFDGGETSSTLQYCLDSITHGVSLAAHVKGAKNSMALLDFVRRTPNAVGFVGVSWVGDKEDSTQTAFLRDIKVLALPSRVAGEQGKYVLPYQANIALARYPFTRALYYVLKENYSGLGRGFVNFLSTERGQLIFKRAYLVPSKMNFNVRTVRLSE